jgi:hypothetical protein
MLHKSHILCLIGHLRHLNNQLVRGRTATAAALSIVPAAHAWQHKDLTKPRLAAFFAWFRVALIHKEAGRKDDFPHPLQAHMMKLLASLQTETDEDKVLVFLLVTRALGWKSRLVINFQTLPLKPPKEEVSNAQMKSYIADKFHKTDADSDKTVADSDKIVADSDKTVANSEHTYANPTPSTSKKMCPLKRSASPSPKPSTSKSTADKRSPVKRSKKTSSKSPAPKPSLSKGATRKGRDAKTAPSPSSSKGGTQKSSSIKRNKDARSKSPVPRPSNSKDATQSSSKKPGKDSSFKSKPSERKSKRILQVDGGDDLSEGEENGPKVKKSRGRSASKKSGVKSSKDVAINNNGAKSGSSREKQKSRKSDSTPVKLASKLAEKRKSSRPRTPPVRNDPDKAKSSGRKRNSSPVKLSSKAVKEADNRKRRSTRARTPVMNKSKRGSDGSDSEDEDFVEGPKKKKQSKDSSESDIDGDFHKMVETPPKKNKTKARAPAKKKGGQVRMHFKLLFC